MLRDMTILSPVWRGWIQSPSRDKAFEAVPCGAPRQRIPAVEFFEGTRQQRISLASQACGQGEIGSFDRFRRLQPCFGEVGAAKVGKSSWHVPNRVPRHMAPLRTRGAGRDPTRRTPSSKAPLGSAR